MDKGKAEASSPSKASDAEKLEWVETFRALEELQKPSGLREKMGAKIKENPFVPIGMLATTGALTFGILAMKSGNKRRSQLMMRTRIAAQGFTVAAILLGIAISAVNRTSTK